MKILLYGKVVPLLVNIKHYPPVIMETCRVMRNILLSSFVLHTETFLFPNVLFATLFLMLQISALTKSIGGQGNTIRYMLGLVSYACL